ncbi:MAG TPA: hypothetical protein VEN78_43160 [Bradyrhizobium sp.]|nr:hypothetical protein [Bradyrhizobium sp.]
MKTAESPTPHIASATHFSIENKVESEESGTPSPCRVLLHAAKNNVQTTSCDRREPRTKVRFILPSFPSFFSPSFFSSNRPNLARLFEDVFSFHFRFSAAVEDRRWRLAAHGKKPTTRSRQRTLRPGIAASWRPEEYCRRRKLSIAAFEQWARRLPSPEDLHKRAENLQKLFGEELGWKPKNGQPKRLKKPRAIATACVAIAVRLLFGRSEARMSKR